MNSRKTKKKKNKKNKNRTIIFLLLTEVALCSLRSDLLKMPLKFSCKDWMMVAILTFVALAINN